MSKTGYRKDARQSKGIATTTTTIEYEVPDGGYGWVVVFSAFIFISLPMGISASFALYYEEWINYFDASEVQTSLIGSVNSGCVPLLGSLGGMALTNLFNDIRVTGIVGCLLSALAMVISAFVTSIKVLTFTYGALGGLGMGLMFNCAYLSVGYYFDKNRPLATAIASSGTGFGTLISLLIRYVIDVYGWRGSLIIMGAVSMQCVVCGVLIRPLFAKKVSNRPTMAPLEEVLQRVDETPETEPIVSVTQKKTDNKKGRQFWSQGDIIMKRSVSSSQNIQKPKFGSHAIMRREIIHHSSAALHPRPGDVKINPYTREDIFFQGSIYDLEMKSDFESPDRNIATSQITFEEVVNQSICGKLVKNFRKNFGLAIFRDSTFLLVVLGMTLHHMAFFIPYTYIISLAREKAIPQEEAAYLIICFGLSNFFFKMVIAYMQTRLNIEELYVCIGSIFLGAVAAMIITLCNDFYQFVLAAVLYGGTSPIVTVYLTNILVRYLGIAQLTNAFSMVTIIRGLGSLSGPPLAGYLIAMTHNIRSAFYVGTAADSLSTLCFVFILYKSRRTVFEASHAASVQHTIVTLEAPRVIVTVPTAEGNIDKLIHYSNDKFDRLTARDQVEHARKMKEVLQHVQ